MTDWRRSVADATAHCPGRDNALTDFDLQVHSGIPEARAARLAIQWACCRDCDKMSLDSEKAKQ